MYRYGFVCGHDERCPRRHRDIHGERQRGAREQRAADDLGPGSSAENAQLFHGYVDGQPDVVHMGVASRLNRRRHEPELPRFERRPWSGTDLHRHGYQCDRHELGDERRSDGQLKSVVGERSAPAPCL